VRKSCVDALKLNKMKELLQFVSTNDYRCNVFGQCLIHDIKVIFAQDSMTVVASIALIAPCLFKQQSTVNMKMS